MKKLIICLFLVSLPAQAVTKKQVMQWHGTYQESAPAEDDSDEQPSAKAEESKLSLCPDNTYVSGPKCVYCPEDNTYKAHKCKFGPDGGYY